MSVTPAVETVAPEGATLTFHDLCYTVDIRKCCSTQPKEILKSIHGVFKPGLNAILGPTGCGKTSLLDTIAGRKDPSGLSGTILVNGKPQPKNFKCMTGYVVQDDVVMGTLTVRENFMFSANLRLGKEVSMKEKKQRVEQTINELGLAHCGDSKIGTPFIRGVSGGERKRTNIGMELIFSPPVLFLDEPTTGLDASTAGAVLQLLKELALKGRTIVFSIHQPRYSIFKLFDQLMLLSKGRIVFHGPSSDALEYFSSIGYDCELHDNPPDFFLDVINGDSSAVIANEKKKEAQVAEELAQAKAAFRNGPANGAGSVTSAYRVSIDMTETQHKEIEEQVANHLADSYNKSRWWKQIMDEVKPIYDDYKQKEESKTLEKAEAVEYHTNVLTQFGYIAKRQLMNSIRSPQATVLQIGINIFLALVVGLLFFDIDNDGTAFVKIQNRVGLFFFSTMNQVFSNLSSLELFISERVIFIHENVSGFYRVSAYFFAKVVCDMIPLRIIPILAFSVIVYFMAGLEADVGKFFIFTLDLLLLSMSAAAICFFVSSGAKVFAVANILCAMMFVAMMIFGGLFVNLESIVVWLRWLQYFSIFRYSLNCLSVNELKGLVVYGADNTTAFGNDVLENQYNIPYERTWDLWVNILALFFLTTGFLALTYLRLRLLNKYK